MRWLIRKARLLDPANGIDRKGDLLIEEGKIARVGGEIRIDGEVSEIEAEGMTLTPSFIDIHVHLREPGREYAERIETGVRAAAAGGFGAVVCMPNTEPALDTHASIRFVIEEAERWGPVKVWPAGAITQGRKGEKLAEMGDLVRGGAVAVTDDGDPVADSDLMRRALEYSKSFDIPILTHPEDKTLSRGGVMNEGVVSTRLGLKGIPAAAEEIGIARDLRLAELSGGRLHVQHVSTAYGAELVRRAKERGLPVTGETAPHYVALTDESLAGYDTNRKMNPPLRTSRDRDALREALASGVLEVVATDHAPHGIHEKETEFDRAPFGVLGLETSFAVMLTHLVRPGHLSLPTLIERMTSGPAGVIGKEHLGIVEGRKASLTLFDTERSQVVDPSRFESLSRNTPFAGERLYGAIMGLFIGGDRIEPVQPEESNTRFPLPLTR